MNKWFKKEIEEMLKGVAKAKSSEEVAEIFEIILTPREINDMAKRLKVVKMLNKKESYSNIKEKLGVGNTTISRIANGIGYGFRRGNSVISEEQKTEKKINKKSKKIIRYKGAASIHHIFD
jgi:TrpR-related protein YerC/YecD